MEFVDRYQLYNSQAQLTGVTEVKDSSTVVVCQHCQENFPTAAFFYIRLITATLFAELILSILNGDVDVCNRNQNVYLLLNCVLGNICSLFFSSKTFSRNHRSLCLK